MLESGTYIAVFVLSRRRRIQVGQLGVFWFEPGVYLYVGSAQRNLSARLARHARRVKPLRWHIDYLSVKAPMIGAMTVPGPRERECELAGELRRMYELTVPGFGASDCGCGGIYSIHEDCDRWLNCPFLLPRLPYVDAFAPQSHTVTKKP